MLHHQREHPGLGHASPYLPPSAAAYPPSMVVQFDDMPPGTLGFRLAGKLDRDEYFQILNPVLEKLERGEKVSFLVEAGDDFHGLDVAALWEDVKAAGSVGLKYRSSWERLAVVTDKDWM